MPAIPRRPVPEHTRASQPGSMTVTGERRATRTEQRRPPWLAGLALATAVAGIATVGGRLVPLVGAPVLGIVLGIAIGIVVARARRRSPDLAPGLAIGRGPLLHAAVVLLGAQVSLLQVVRVGAGSLPVMLGTLAACLLGAVVAGRALGIGRDLRTLIGVGTAICGASAIAAVSPVIRARSNDVAYAVSTIFVFNVAAVLLFPAIGHALGMGQDAFGLFAGTAVNDTSSVVAAASSYGPQAADHAVVVKLARSMMIIPVCLVLAALVRRREPREPGTPGVGRLVPGFLIGFVLVAAANSAGLVPAALQPALRDAALFLITVAMSAIGLSTDLPALRRAGTRPLGLGALLWVLVTGTSLGIQAVAM